MIVTGIAHPPARLHERSEIPSSELVFLAKMGLNTYRATHLITGLAQGWEQALAKAAIELEIPYSVAIPFPGRDADWKREARLLYLDLLARASDVYRVCDEWFEEAVMEGHFWRVDRSEIVLALWDFEFQGDTFQTMSYGLKTGRTVVNLWNEWSHLYSLRRARPVVSIQNRKIGAQVFEIGP
jgi:uncharacterized phage-like protein YoqJ